MSAGAADRAHEIGDQGVSFPEVDGRRSTTATCRAILADAAAAVDPALQERIGSCTRWRRDYVEHLRELTALSAGREPALAIAHGGVQSMRTRLSMERGGRTVSLAHALQSFEPSVAFGTGRVSGSERPVTALRVPYRGKELEGRSLSEQLDRWVGAGSVEPSFAEAVGRVIEHPEWLSLPGRKVALVGAGAEIGPLQPLCTWGAEVIALDVPDARVWRRIGELARGGAGTVQMPLAPDGSAGLDVVRLLPEARQWLMQTLADDDLALGMYAYADGGTHVRLSAAFDALATDVLERRPRSALSFLATPTDAYLVDQQTVARSRAAYADRRVRKVLQTPAQLLSGGRLFAPAYRGPAPVADALVPQQGPNYAIAKRLQRWRGVLASAAGQRVSFNVAPATWTRSVTKNRVLAAAYAGARHFGVEIFAPATTRTLMAAMLVHDLHQEGSDAGTEPERLFSDNAAHGGLWSAAYEPRSALGIAALAGLPSTVLRRRPRA